MSTLPKVSILISAYEQLEYTQKCLKQIRKTLTNKLPYEILLVDDASSKQTVEALKELIAAPHQLILNQNRKGYAHNNNLAAQKATGEYLCLLNNDVFVQGDWLTPMLNVFSAKKDAGMVGNVQRLYRNNLFDHMGVVFAPQGNPRHFGQHFFFHPFREEIREWSGVTGACCVCKKEVFEKLGGFDEVFINGCEDMDLCLRLRKLGYRNYVAHQSIVIHVKGATEGRKKYNVQNAEILEKRWGDYIRTHLSPKDQYLHSWTYMRRFVAKPFACNLGKFLEAMSILLRLKSIH